MNKKHHARPPYTPPRPLSPPAPPSGGGANGSALPPPPPAPPLASGPQVDMQKTLEGRQQMVDFVASVLDQVKTGGVHGVGIALVTEKGLGAGFSLMTDGFLLSGAIERLRVQLEEGVLHPNIKVEREQRTRIVAGQLSEDSLAAVLNGIDAKVAAGTMSEEQAEALKIQLEAVLTAPPPMGGGAN